MTNYIYKSDYDYYICPSCDEILEDAEYASKTIDLKDSNNIPF